MFNRQMITIRNGLKIFVMFAPFLMIVCQRKLAK